MTVLGEVMRCLRQGETIWNLVPKGPIRQLVCPFVGAGDGCFLFSGPARSYGKKRCPLFSFCKWPWTARTNVYSFFHNCEELRP